MIEDYILDKYRKLFNFSDKFDIVLLAGYREKEGATKEHLDFYENIANRMAMEDIGKTTFLPHVHLKDRSDDDSIGIMSRIVMPTADLILDYNVLYSPLCLSARNVYIINSFKPKEELKKIIHLYELDNPEFEKYRYLANESNTISIRIPKQSLEKIVRIVKDFYKRDVTPI